MDVESAVIGAAIAAIPVFLMRFAETIAIVVSLREKRNRKRNRKLSAVLSHLLELRSLALARRVMRRLLVDWCRESGVPAKHVDVAWAQASAALPEISPEFATAVNALAVEFPMIAWKLRKHIPQRFFSQFPEEEALQLQGLTHAVLGELTLESLDDALILVAGKIGSSVLRDVKRILEPEDVTTDPEFGRMTEEIKSHARLLAGQVP